MSDDGILKEMPTRKIRKAEPSYPYSNDDRKESFERQRDELGTMSRPYRRRDYSSPSLYSRISTVEVHEDTVRMRRPEFFDNRD